MNTLSSPSQEAEERLVAELEQLGVRYLARQTAAKAHKVRAPHQLMADLARQPSSRVRAALISVLLANPGHADHVPAALELLNDDQKQNFKFFYTAAVVLQRKYAAPLKAVLKVEWRWLTDWFGTEIDLPAAPPQEQLKALAHRHQQMTGVTLNWAGTYEQAARQLLRRLEREQMWNR